MSSVRRTFRSRASGAVVVLAVAGGLLVTLSLLLDSRPDSKSPVPGLPSGSVGVTAGDLEAPLPEPSRAMLALSDAPPHAAVVGIADAVRGAAVRVGISLKYDAGDPPTSLSVDSRYSRSLKRIVLQSQALSRAGWLLSDDTVILRDLQIHPRFVDRVWVSRKGAPSIFARISAYLANVDAMILTLHRPLRDAQPLAFGSAPGPYFAVSYGKEASRWGLLVHRTMERVRIFDDGTHAARIGTHRLIVGADGTPVDLSTARMMRIGSDWRGSPLNWSSLSRSQYDDAQRALAAKVARGLPRVHLRFRSPKKDVALPSRRSYLRNREDEETASELDATGVIIDSHRLLVLADLKRSVTARLERVDVHLPDGTVVPARHEHSLSAYGAFLARTEDPLGGALTRNTLQPEALLDRLLLTASVVHRAERRVLQLGHARLEDVKVGYGGQVVPDFEDSVRDQHLFLPTGELVALGILRRDRATRPRWADQEAVMLPVAHLTKLLRDPGPHADANNVPRAPERERRLAWLGVELQTLDDKLARANDVAHLTADGSVGSLVSYVYANSPAAGAGLQVGDILIRIHVSRFPKPFPVGGTTLAGRDYVLDLSELEDPLLSYGSRAPRRPPWPSVENALNKTLTTIGVGRTFALEYVAAGVVRKKELHVAPGPPHFAVAAHHEAKALGLTVKTLTYEVRRHHQLASDAGGVVVAEVEGGKPAAVAGVRKYEILALVDGKPIPDVAAFKKLTAGGGTLRFTLRGGGRERIVSIRAR